MQDYKILVTGGAGFMGSNFIRHMLNKHPDYEIVNLDKMTYAGNPNNLKDIENNKNYLFVKGDICDKEVVEKLAKNADAIVNFAAETHVDRSIIDASPFVRTNVFGTHILLQAAKKCGIKKFIQISTDEVYGSILEGSFKESDALNPSSPYSASKAGADMLVLSYSVTFGLPIVIMRCTNNFGYYQYPEKLIPLFVINAIQDKPLPLYGDGTNVRDWLFVLDFCEAADLILREGKVGKIYNVASGNEKANNEIARIILKELNKPESLITYVEDRPGHDKRYSLDWSKIKALGWRPRHKFNEAMRITVQWYEENSWWWKPLKSHLDSERGEG